MWAWKTRNTTELQNLGVMNNHFLLDAPLIDQQHYGLFISFRKLANAGNAAFPEMVMSDALSDLITQFLSMSELQRGSIRNLGCLSMGN